MSIIVTDFCPLFLVELGAIGQCSREMTDALQRVHACFPHVQAWQVVQQIINNNQQILYSFTEKNIKKFMASYRAKFPWATVLPKMHVMEDHTIPCWGGIEWGNRGWSQFMPGPYVVFTLKHCLKSTSKA